MKLFIVSVSRQQTVVLPFCGVVGAMAQLRLHGMSRCIHFDSLRTIIKLPASYPACWLVLGLPRNTNTCMILVVETDVNLIHSLTRLPDWLKQKKCRVRKVPKIDSSGSPYCASDFRKCIFRLILHKIEYCSQYLPCIVNIFFNLTTKSFLVSKIWAVLAIYCSLH